MLNKLTSREILRYFQCNKLHSSDIAWREFPWHCTWAVSLSFKTLTNHIFYIYWLCKWHSFSFFFTSWFPPTATALWIQRCCERCLSMQWHPFWRSWSSGHNQKAYAPAASVCRRRWHSEAQSRLTPDPPAPNKMFPECNLSGAFFWP